MPSIGMYFDMFVPATEPTGTPAFVAFSLRGLMHDNLDLRWATVLHVSAWGLEVGYIAAQVRHQRMVANQAAPRHR